MPKASIRVYLIFLVGAIVVPMLIFTAFLLAELGAKEAAALERRTLREARSVVGKIEPILAEMRTTLQAVSSAPELRAGDFRTFHSRTREALSQSNIFVIVLDGEGNQLLNTRTPFDQPLGKTSNMTAFAEVLENGDFTVSDVFLGKTSGKVVFNVMHPLRFGLDNPARIIVTTKNADELGEAIQTEGLPDGWQTAVLDKAGNVVSATDPELKVGVPPPFYSRQIEGGLRLGGIYRGDFDGVPGIAARVAFNNWQWSAIVWGPTSTAQATILSTWKKLIYGGLGLFALSMLATYFVARSLSASIRRLARMADRMGEGGIVSPISSNINEFNIVAKTLSTASFDRDRAEEQLRIVMDELAHRSKNLMAIIQATIRQSARGATSVDEFKEVIVGRIGGLGRSIDLLTQTHWKNISLEGLVKHHLQNFMNSDAQLTVTGKPILLKSEAVQNLGLALHELATNAVKYGSLSTPRGSVEIGWETFSGSDDSEQFRLTWVEKGGPPSAPPERSSFGTQITTTHMEAAFIGNVDLEYARDGLRWSLKAPLRNFVEDEASN
uniref:sensor histidine kinase n=1 Tax=Pararhizobium sp. IMCC3301 TaxID=3067904 RepID=UPI00274198DE|nr:sensor histidine kinase [Pararhizobium sp. IMCC3301]